MNVYDKLPARLDDVQTSGSQCLLYPPLKLNRNFEPIRAFWRMRRNQNELDGFGAASIKNMCIKMVQLLHP